MKILLTNTAYYPTIGGIEDRMWLLSKALLKLGHAPEIFCMAIPGQLTGQETLDGVPVVRHEYYSLPKKLANFNPLYQSQKLQPLFLKEFKDVDQIWAGNCVYCYASSKALPQVPHIYFQVGATPKGATAAMRISRFRRKIAARLVAYQYYYLEKRAIRASNKIVICSKLHLKQVCSLYSCSPAKFVGIPHWVDLKRFSPRERETALVEELDLPSQAKVVLSVCRLSPEKNLSLLIRVFSKIKVKEGYLIIVGDGPERLFLEQLARELGMESKVRFVGFQRETERYYSLADVFVLPSTYEGWGIVLTEAMASGVPCLGLKADYPKIMVASEEIIKSGETGYCVDPYSEEDLKEKIETILLDSDLRHNMGQAARKLCEQRYSWSEYLKQVSALVENKEIKGHSMAVEVG